MYVLLHLLRAAELLYHFGFNLYKLVKPLRSFLDLLLNEESLRLANIILGFDSSLHSLFSDFVCHLFALKAFLFLQLLLLLFDDQVIMQLFGIDFFDLLFKLVI